MEVSQVGWQQSAVCMLYPQSMSSMHSSSQCGNGKPDIRLKTLVYCEIQRDVVVKGLGNVRLFGEGLNVKVLHCLFKVMQPL